MDGGTGPGAELLSPAEAEWPPELRLPPLPPPTLLQQPKENPAPAPPPVPQPQLQKEKEPAPPRPAEGFDDQHFLGSIMGPAAAAQPQPQQPAAAVAAVEVPVKRKRGRPRKNPVGAPPPPTLGMQQPKETPAPAPPPGPHPQLQKFLGSIMGPATAQPHPQPQQPAAAAVEAPVKRKRGRPRKNPEGAPPPPKPPASKDEEIVCFICFDGGNLVVCDRRCCPKVYHPACVKRDESFFRGRGKWDCGWHICSICEKAAQYMCYTCTYSLCKGCIGQGNFFGVRGNKGFCDTCYATISLIESKDEGASKIRVDFDDKSSWEYLFKLYWLYQKGKHLLTLEELIGAKSRWTVPTNVRRGVKEESSDESYDASNDEPDASFDISSRKRRRNNSSGKRGRKRQNVTQRKPEISVKGFEFESLPNRLPTEGMVSQGDTTWASAELLEFIGHMRNGDSSYISKYDVHLLLFEYIKQNNLRDPKKNTQIICDARLSSLFRKPRVARFEMLKLLEMHFHVKDNPAAKTDSNQVSAKLGSDKRRKVHKKIDSELPANLQDYAAIDMHNINLIYLRRSLMEDLIDDKAAFSDKIAGAFVRIRVSGLGQKQDTYRLVKVLGTHKVTERYSVGKKTTDYALEILNLDKKELITVDTISNQDFTEEECKRLRQSMKFGLVARLKVGDIYEKAKIFRSLQCNELLENEKQRLSHLRDRASENGRRKELRECVEKLQLLNTPEERARRINEVPEVHVDPRMAPDYESAEEQNFKRSAGWTVNRSESDLFFPERKGTQSNSVEHRQKSLDSNGHMSRLPMEDMAHKSGADISSGAILSDTEPENVWHYRDPSGTVQGPFTLLQLSNWAPHFPSDLRIWLTFDSEKNSLLLTEVLKQQKYFVLPSSVTAGDTSIGTGTEQDRTKSGLVANNLSSCMDYNTVHSSGLSCHSAAFSDPTKEGSTAFCGTSPSRSPKDAHNFHGQVQHQVNYSCTIPSLTTPDSHDVRVSSEQVDKLKNCQDIGGLWNPTVPSTIHTFKSNIEGNPHPQSDEYTMKDQLQNDSKGPAASLHTISPLEFICKEDNTCWCAAANASSCDDLHLSISLANQETCSPTNAVEDRDSSSASGDRVGVSACHPQLQYISVTNSSNIVNRHNTSLTDASSKPSDQHSELNNDPAFSDTHQDECEYPSPTPKLERKQTYMNRSGPLSVTPKDSGTKTCDSSISIASESCGPPAGKTCNLQSLNQTSCLEERHSSDRDITAQKGQLNEEIMTVNLLGAKLSDNFMSTSAEEQPQCSSPIALSPWGEQNYYQGEAVDSALWGAQDDCSNDMWSMHSPTPALQASSGLRADGRDASSIIEEMMAAQESSTFVETLIKQGEKKMEQGNSSASRGSGALEEVKTKPSSVSGLSLDGTTKAADFQLSVTAREGNAKASRWNPPGLLLEGFTKASDWQPSDISKESGSKAWQPSDSSLGEGAKACGLQRSSSCPDGSRKSSKEGSVKDSARQQSSVSPEGSRKTSGFQRSDSSALGNTKASIWQPSGSYAEQSVKADDWQRTSSSPEGSRKVSGWNRSIHESSRANSTSGANENHKSSSIHQATTTSSKNLWEAPMGQGNRIEKTVSWGEALGSAERSVKADGWQRTSPSSEGSRKASGWHQSVRESSRANSTSGANENQKFSSRHQVTTSKNLWEAPMGQGNSIEKTVIRGAALGSAERSVKADVWQRTSSSPEGSRKGLAWHQSFHQSSRANSASGANENHKSSSSHQATTTSSKNLWEAPMRQGISIEKTVSWGAALGNNKSWNPSSGNASWGSQGVHNRDRHSHGGDSRQGNSSYSRRSDNRHEHDHHRDHDRSANRHEHDHHRDHDRSGNRHEHDHHRDHDRSGNRHEHNHHRDHDRSGSSRSLSRGQLQRGVCKYYQRGNCFRGNKCHYEHC